ncbi:MAG: hypothetical protein ACKVS9_07625 [Phycisphaerae bacterium]
MLKCHRQSVLVSFAALCCLALAVPASAQSKSVQWGLDMKKGIAEAQKSKKPMMVWIIGSSDDRANDAEREQKKSFANPLIVELSKRFVCVRLSRTNNMELLKQWNLPPATNLDIVFVTPAGDKIDTISAVGSTLPESLAQKMSLVFRSHRSRLFNDEIKAVLADTSAKPVDLKNALQTIEDLIIDTADSSVVELCKRDGLDDPTLIRSYAVLAELSTSPAIKFLVDAAATDKRAADALAKATPGGAEVLLEFFDGTDTDKRLLAYTAAAKICKIKDPKPEGFWKNPNEKIKTDELARVRKAVESKAKTWRDTIGQYR